MTRAKNKEKPLPPDKNRGERLRELRDHLHADSGAIGKGAGVSGSGVRKWEGGASISRTALWKLVFFYGANPRWIVDNEEPRYLAGVPFLDRLERVEAAVAANNGSLQRLAKSLNAEAALGPQPHEVVEGADEDTAEQTHPQSG